MHHSEVTTGLDDFHFSLRSVTAQMTGEQSEVVRELIAEELADMSGLLLRLQNEPFTSIIEGNVTHTENTLIHRIATLTDLYRVLIP